MFSWGAIGATALVTIGLVASVRSVAWVLAGGRAPVRVLPFQSGHRPVEHALSRFHARWYPLTLLFLAFDVEMLFMYPWAVVVVAKGAAAAAEMFGFLGVLLAGVVWAWREGVLRWV
ncbi:NAD(P)H-quinone oxidoreductase subunit 3, chloroplastic [Cellulomonas sp. T2.31MG-18]|uniref:NADH-quinone oxidoreductase subunit A n=1 Tax=Cellulomonas sp. T2.31MG-18 TaxID=3157619 RepID=UPI0035F03AE9